MAIIKISRIFLNWVGKITCLIGVVFFLSGCIPVKPLQIKKIDSIKVQEGSINRGVLVTVNITLYNPNWFKFFVEKSDIEVSVEGLNLGKLSIPKDITIKSKDEFTGEFSLEVGFKQLLLAGGNVLSKIKSGKFELNLNGTIDAKALGVSKEYEINHTEQVMLK